MRLVLAAILLCLSVDALAQEHSHPPQDAPIHEQFYSTWMMPDRPGMPCCNKQDCYPTEIKYENGHLYARRREDGAWVLVPPEKIESNRDNPDGRNHVCMAPPWNGDRLYCFTLGSGT